MAGLTTHVLDTSNGKPAKNMRIDLFFEESTLIKINSFITNKDGRVSNSLLSNKELNSGVYELHFYVGKYFDFMKTKLPKIKFLDIVKIRFGIHNIDDHYHVPLLVSPYGYSTYRGS